MSAGQGHGAKVKGSSRERELAKKLSAWSGEKVMRTLSSGAGGTRADGDIRMTGDLFFPIGSANPFNYEVKDHATTRIQHVFNNNGDIPSFLEQATTDARRGNPSTVPMLIFHISREADYILVPYTKALFRQLRDSLLPVQAQMSYFQDDKTKQVNKIPTLLTDLKSLTTIPAETLFEWYADCNWDYMNQDFVVKHIDTESLVAGVLKNDSQDK